MDKYDMSVFAKKKDLQDALDYTKNHYRPHDPGNYLYYLTFNYKFSQKFDDKFFELLYATLISWNMNSRAAKLSDFEKFTASILSHKDDFKKLEKVTIVDLESQKGTIKKLFNELELVDTKTPLVTFSKTLHFILPNLIAPIDRKYTLRFFYGKNPEGCFTSRQKQFEVFWKIEMEFSKYAQKQKDLSSYVEVNGWNRSIPKVLDNAVIGYISPTVERENKKRRAIEKKKREEEKAILASHK